MTTSRLLALAALVLAGCASTGPAPESSEHEIEVPPIEESPVWVLEDDGSWTCVPGGTDPSVCENATGNWQPFTDDDVLLEVPDVAVLPEENNDA